MATQLIKHLKNCAENDAIYSPLVYQWGFDEQLIAKALQNVSMYFPHYSRHDESHSRQILVHIERLLGENLTKLTATDTWLLLEAAYLHDIGMVVTDEQLNKNFEEIKKHAESMKYSANEDLLSVINALSTSKTNTASAIFASVNLEAFQTLKLLREIIADYYRKKHPEQAGKIITHPLLEIGLDSPRNELLPARFFGLLSKICEYHGANFEKVMELPQQQVGMGTEDCHPRFVACLLRLGDLLDLDDNRFCPVMMKMAGDLPDLSKAHHQKHLAIRHFRADPDRIEITAECPDYESYIQTTTWFGWLRDEVKNQMSRWFDIVPARHFGLLPSVGDLKAHLKEWQVFSENQRPHFELDRDRIFELLQGAGLYECKEQAMRELLQNAVDATLIRIWREHGEDCQPQPESFIARDSAPPRYNNEQEKENKKLCDIFKRYAIDVIIEKIESEKKEDEQYNYWRITIADQGTGISREDLKFMMQMGSSKKNSNRREIIEKMPVWMKPSGIFGIGLHSVFLLTDEVLIETRSIDTGETLVIRLTDPTDKKEHGNVYFQIITEPKEIELANNKKQKFKPWDFSNFGCRLSFIYKTDKTTTPSKNHKDVNSKLQDVDGLIESIEDLYIQNTINYICDYVKNSYLTFSLEFYKKHRNLKNNNLTDTSYYYSFSQKLELLFKELNTDHDEDPYEESNRLIQFYYRWQEIDDRPLDFKFIHHIIVNLLDDDADKLLTINRNKFKSGTNNHVLFNRVSNAIQEFFNSTKGKDYYNSCQDINRALIAEEQDINRTLIAAEYEFQEWKKQDYFSDWRQLPILTENGKKSLLELIGYNIIYYDIIPTYLIKSDKKYTLKYKEFLDKHQNNILIPSYDNSNITIISEENYGFPLLNKILKENNYKSKYSYETILDIKFSIATFTKHSESDPLSNEALKDYCCKLLHCRKECYLKRLSIPCLSKYSLLILKQHDELPKLHSNGFNYIDIDFKLDLISPRMLFPLARIGDKITVGDLDILAKRVYKNRADKNTTEAQIKQSYQEFIAFLDDLMKDDAEWVKLRSDEFKPNLITHNKN